MIDYGKLATYIRKSALAMFFASLSLAVMDVQATNLNISPVPLYLGGAVEPNVMFTLDDSGSMSWSFMPDGISGDRYTKRGKAYEYNAMYYNPRVIYTAPVNAYGVSLGDASFRGAWDNGYDKAHTCTVDLARNYDFERTWWGGAHCDGYRFTGVRAYYYVYYTDHPAGPKPRPSGCSDSINDDSCYIRVTVGANSGVGGKDERTNFANWYSYYRRRIYTAKAGVGRAFAQQGTGLRVGFGAINNYGNTVDGVKTDTITRGVRHFDGVDREQFFSLLYGERPSGYTPLRRAMDDVGRYFSRTDSRGPWSSTPGQRGGTDYICRQSYHILMSDGYYNGGGANTSGAQGDNDSTSGPTNTGPNGRTFRFTAVSPFRDGVDNKGNIVKRSGTLADVAMYYWKNDLRPDAAMPNQVPTSPQDPAFWQHLTTYTVGLGVTGNILPKVAFDAIKSGAAVNWPDPTKSDPAKIDDMLHAAVDSRGDFFSAKNPTAFAAALSKILFDITDRNSSSSAVALNSGSLYGGSRLFQARFNTKDWSGELDAYAIQQDGSVSTSPVWSASGLVPSASSRRIVTFDGSGGTPFEWSSLTTAQQAALVNTATLNFLRGDRSNETPKGNFRQRSSVLGDIIHSAPLFVGPPSAGYPNYWGPSQPENSVPYTSYVISKSSRTPMVFVGSNDGMLHGFNAKTGVEMFAYVPSVLIPRLPELSKLGYAHKYYVDGSPVALDAYFQSDSSWHTVLTGGLAGGGQAIYALDISDAPTSSDTESTLSNRVLWEFTDADDADLGYTYSKPNIVRLANGKWGVIFGNGYNNTDTDTHVSSTGDAVLYIVDIETGSIIKKLDTGVGSADDPTGSNRPNGLSTVAPVDVDGDHIVDYVYGGDLFGNLWKFDLSNSAVSKWKIAYGTTNTPKPLFQARAVQSNPQTAQPITVRPVVGRHESGYGFMVYFGTGKYFEVGDNSTVNQDTQTFYAVWDQNDISPALVINRSYLTQQKILREVTASGYVYRLTTDIQPKWDDPKKSGVSKTAGQNDSLGWFMDLYNTNMGSNTANYGERQVTDPVLRGHRIIFTTLLPLDNPCDFGGSGWLMELDARTGKRLPYTPFDTNGDGIFNASDTLIVDINNDGTNDHVPAAGKKSKVGILPSPAVISDKAHGREYKYESGSTGQIEVTTENPGPGDSGRTSWLELIQY